MGALNKKMTLGAETSVEMMEQDFDELRRNLLLLEPPPDAEVKVSITVKLPFGLQQRLPLETRERELVSSHG